MLHSKGLRFCSRMTKEHYRRWVIVLIEKTIWYGTAMIILSLGCVVTALIIGWCLQKLGVAYG